ncbi:MerR family transcriptional regulator [Enterococcus sp. DIV1420a]
MNYTMSELADLFGVTKDVIKYHRKQLPAAVVTKNEQGIVLISEEGTES